MFAIVGSSYAVSVPQSGDLRKRIGPTAGASAALCRARISKDV